MSNWHGNIRTCNPGWKVWHRGFRLVQLDERGAGMSQRDLPGKIAFTDYVLDVEAVLAELSLGPVILFGLTNHALTAINFAASHPEQVAALVLGTLTRVWAQRSSVWTGLPAEDWDLFLRGLVPRDMEPEVGRRMVELLKQSFTADDFTRRRHSLIQFELDPDVVARVKAPALILHPRDYAFYSPEDSMKMAQALSAKLVLLDGWSVFGDADQGIRAIETFLSGIAPAAAVPEQRDGSLSSREVEVLRLIAAGRSNAQIAGALVISPNTVGRHVSNIFDKLGFANRAEATAYALRNGLA
jgi:DNA-binding CsgD family transcriptional regulator/pimeloyl-ACP methyl ester carboxylesterase